MACPKGWEALTPLAAPDRLEHRAIEALAALEIAGLRDRYGHLPLVPYGELSSEHELMSKEEIRNMLDKGGFLS